MKVCVRRLLGKLERSIKDGSVNANSIGMRLIDFNDLDR